MISLSGTEIKS